MDTNEPRKPKFTQLTPETYQQTPYARLMPAADRIRKEVRQSVLDDPSDAGSHVPEPAATQKPPGSDA